jgi:acetylglutamate kinase
VRALVKLGGTLLDEDASRSRIAEELARLSRSVEIVVVHGGGKQMTRYLAEQGVESQFVRGLRVTTPEVTDALLKIFAGSVNHQLVAALQAAGASAVGLSGLDAGLAVAEQLDPALGAVGRIVATDGRLLDHLIAGGFLPVVACVAGGRGGAVFNVNADLMAVALAGACRAESLVFLTDVPGVKGEDGKTIRSLTIAGCRRLIESKVASGGMEAKLNASIQALLTGVRRVVIAPGAVADVIANAIRDGVVGTEIVAPSMV